MAAAQLVRRAAGAPRTVAGTAASTASGSVGAALLAAVTDSVAARPSARNQDLRSNFIRAMLNLPTLIELSMNERRAQTRENEEKPLDLSAPKKKKKE
jgi:hypothetical protein